MNTLSRAIEHFDGVDKALADAIGVTPQRLSNWKSRGVPPAMWLRIEKATNQVVTVADFDAEYSKAAA